MSLFEKIIDRIGLMLIKPREACDLLAVEGANIVEGVVVSTLSILGLTTIATMTSNSTLDFYLEFSIIFFTIYLIWVLFSFVFSVVIKSLYKVPGSPKEHFSLLSYTLVSSVFPVLFLLTLSVFNITKLVFDVIGIAVGLIWFFWLLFLVYMITNRFYKIDFKQFIASFVLSVIITGLILGLILFTLVSIFFPIWRF